MTIPGSFDSESLMRSLSPGGARRKTPADIIRIGQRNPVVAMLLREWEGGSLTWDEALAWMVVILDDHNEKLMHAARMELPTIPPIRVTKPTPVSPLMQCTRCGKELLDAVKATVALGGPQVCDSCIDRGKVRR